jgi:hypothetical protein
LESKAGEVHQIATTHLKSRSFKNLCMQGIAQCDAVNVRIRQRSESLLTQFLAALPGLPGRSKTPWYPRFWTKDLPMSRVNVEIELPDSLATQAKKAGLLEPEALERMVREALLARRVKDLAKARDVLAAKPLPPMTPEEIQAEIDAYRADVRRAARP